MEENKSKINTEDLKNETKTTINEVKESVKNVNVKDEAKATTGFVSALIKDPLAKIKEISSDKNNKNLESAIILLIVWTVAIFIKAIAVNHWAMNFGGSFLNLIKSILAPILSILAISTIAYCMQKKEKKSLATIITTTTTAQVPTILAVILSLITLFSTSAYKLTTPVLYYAQVISTVFTYFALKDIWGEENNSEFIKKFAIIEAIYFAVCIVISFLEISLFVL